MLTCARPVHCSLRFHIPLKVRLTHRSPSQISYDISDHLSDFPLHRHHYRARGEECSTRIFYLGKVGYRGTRRRYDGIDSQRVVYVFSALWIISWGAHFSLSLSPTLFTRRLVGVSSRYDTPKVGPYIEIAEHFLTQFSLSH